MTDSAQHTIRVNLGPRSYDIIIGDKVLTDLNTHLEPIITGRRVHIITDKTVYGLHGDTLSSLRAQTSLTILPPGESQKSFPVLQHVLNDMLAENLGRNDIVIAFGGGVIGDLAGFAASIYKRGCRFVQIPTTLLAQVDSSVGGKTAINVPQGKNLIGAFYQPALVLADTSVLQTLPKRQIKAGYAEVLKYGLLGDAQFFNWLETHGHRILDLDPEAVAYAVSRSCKAKARIVAADEEERGQRALLNFGHTFAHALEAEAGFDGRLLHGEAVSAGMDMAFEFCARSGLCPKEDAARVREHLRRLDMPHAKSFPHLLNPKSLLSHMHHDKKNDGGHLTLILARNIGDAYVNPSANPAAVLDYLTELSTL